MVDGAGDLFEVTQQFETIGEYNASTGATINANLITGLQDASGLAFNGSGDLYVTEWGNGLANTGLVGEYSASTGAAVNASFISGLTRPEALVLDGSGDLFLLNAYVSSGNPGSVSEYNATTGTAINSNLITTGLDDPFGIALDGPDLYVTNYIPGTIGEYNANTGAAIQSSLSPGSTAPIFLPSSPSRAA